MKFLEKLQPLSLLLLRCALGIIFMYKGFPKLFGPAGSFQQLFTSHGMSASFVYVAGVLELFGGGLLILGLFTRVAALLLAIEMGVAIWKINLPQGIYAIREYEFPLTLAAAAFALATVGAGAISLDYPLFRTKGKLKTKGKS